MRRGVLLQAKEILWVHMIIKHKKVFIVLLAVLVLAVCAYTSLQYIRTSESKLAYLARRLVESIVYPPDPDPREGLDIIGETLYVDDIPAQKTSFVRGKDNKLVIETPDAVRLCNYTTGYYLDLPPGTTFDFGKSPKFVTFFGEGFTGVISRERAAESQVSGYVEHYFHRFILNESFQADNRIRVIENTKDGDVNKITLLVDDPGNRPSMYTHLIIETGSVYFYRIMLKYNEGHQQITDVIKNISGSFCHFRPKGYASYSLDFKPEIPEHWSAETKALYARFAGPGNFMWGIFTEDVKNNGIDSAIPVIEQALEYKFELILAYSHLPDEFPAEFMQKCHDEGRTVQLTYQLTDNNNEDLYTRSPLLELYRGKEFPEIRAFAKKAKEFGHPFLFRLNNEMNSDWTSYGGVNNLLDPDIYIEGWRTVYEIFEEEGVNNAIWIFNPNDVDFPPNNWNSAFAYYPGNSYVHMLGVTGYNTGTYYQDVTGESWREFKDIYDGIAAEYDGAFDGFPWIITEFSSSSVGGDKAKWIDGMFNSLELYPNIKAAVWFSSADYDPRPGYEEKVGRPYWLDETPEVLEAFKKGLHR